MIDKCSINIFQNIFTNNKNIKLIMIYKYFYKIIKKNEFDVIKSINKNASIISNIKYNYEIKKNITFINPFKNNIIFSQIDNNELIKGLTFDEFVKKYHNDLNYQKKINDLNIRIKQQSDAKLNKFINYLNSIISLFFISLDIKNDIYNNFNKFIKVKFDKGKLYIYYNDKEFDDDKIYNIIDNIIIITNWLYILKNDINCKTVKINISLSNIKRKIYNDNVHTLSPLNINGGSSGYDCINIWRYEEIYKVLIHELIHYLKLDINGDHAFNNSIDVKLGNNGYPLLLNESITELQAQYLNSIYVTYNINNKSMDNIVNKFITLYSFELTFSWLQFMKYCQYYHIDNFDNFYENNNFDQTTNIFSYVVLKSIYNLFNFDILSNINHLYINEKNTCSYNKCEQIVDLTKKLFDRNKKNVKHFLSEHNKIKHIFNKYYFNPINYKYDNNFRMTLFSLC